MSRYRPEARSTGERASMVRDVLLIPGSVSYDWVDQPIEEGVELVNLHLRDCLRADRGVTLGRSAGSGNSTCVVGVAVNRAA